MISTLYLKLVLELVLDDLIYQSSNNLITLVYYCDYHLSILRYVRIICWVKEGSECWIIIVIADSVFLFHSSGTRRYTCGMVIAPLSWCRGEWVDYTFAAALLPCLQRLLFTGNCEINDNSHSNLISNLSHIKQRFVNEIDTKITGNFFTLINH